jgi:hypothetical protein
VDVGSWQRLEEVAGRLSAISRQNRYNVYEIFEWPATLPTDTYWISPELMTCHGTAVWDELTDEQRIGLSHRESVSFFSLNVHLIRELIAEVVHRIYTTRYPGLSEFFHDFIAEENAHAWFFATFCARYGGKVYATRQVSYGAQPTLDVLRDVGVFGRILIAEELCDFFNTHMASDARLPHIVREVNRVHHEDESRHIAFGRQIMRALADEARERAQDWQLREVRQYLARYITACVRSFYNREAYLDAGIPDAAGFRRRVLADPSRSEAHRAVLGRTVSFLERTGLLESGLVRW